MARQPRPKARCPTCGTVSIYSEHIGQRCVAHPHGSVQRCQGRFKAATAWDDWIVCPACRASGDVDGEPCQHCHGDGWHYRLQPGTRDGTIPVPVRRVDRP